MLAYMVERTLRRSWTELDTTVQEGLEQLKTISSLELRTKPGGCCLRIPQPRQESQKLLAAINLRLPEALPHTDVRVVTRRKLPDRRNKL
jgi:hypothetical protein